MTQARTDLFFLFAGCLVLATVLGLLCLSLGIPLDGGIGYMIQFLILLIMGSGIGLILVGKLTNIEE